MCSTYDYGKLSVGFCDSRKLLVSNSYVFTNKKCSQQFQVLAPDNFWIVYANQLPKFDDMTASLYESASTCVAMEVMDVIPGALCIVKLEEDYYRARVEYITTCKTNVMVIMARLT